MQLKKRKRFNFKKDSFPRKNDTRDSVCDGRIKKEEILKSSNPKNDYFVSLLYLHHVKEVIDFFFFNNKMKIATFKHINKNKESIFFLEIK